MSRDSLTTSELRNELLLWRSGAVIVVVTVVLGALQGLLWSLIAPGEQYFVNPDGQYGALPTESYHQFTDIAIFALIGLVVAFSLGALSWRWRSVRGISTVLVVAGANGLGALTAYLLGRVLASGVDPAGVGASSAVSVVNAAPTLGNVLVIIVQPAVAVAVYTFLAAWNGHPDLSRSDSATPDRTDPNRTDPNRTDPSRTDPSRTAPEFSPVPVRAWSAEDG